MAKPLTKSGIGNMDGFNEIQNKVRSLKDIRHLYSSIETTFEPGSQWRYSNAGMMLLGQVIEEVTGNSYFDHINEHVYQKANLRFLKSSSHILQILLFPYYLAYVRIRKYIKIKH